MLCRKLPSCHNTVAVRILRVVAAVKAGLKAVSACTTLLHCFKGAHLTLDLSIGSTFLCSSACSNHEHLHTSSRSLCGADMRNTNSTQQMSACALLTNTAWQLDKPGMEGELAIRATPCPGIKLPCCEVQACPCRPHCSTPLSPASSMSIKSLTQTSSCPVVSCGHAHADLTPHNL